MPVNVDVGLLGERTPDYIPHHTHPPLGVYGPSIHDMKIGGLSAVSRLMNFGGETCVFYEPEPEKDSTKVFQVEGIELHHGERYGVVDLGKYRRIPSTDEASQSIPLRGEALFISRGEVKSAGILY